MPYIGSSEMVRFQDMRSLGKRKSGDMILYHVLCLSSLVDSFVLTIG